MVEIASPDDLMSFLKGKPADWSQVISMRVALRTLPFAFLSGQSDQWVSNYALSLFRATAMAWAARNVPSHYTGDVGSHAIFNAAYAVDASSFPGDISYSAAAAAAFNSALDAADAHPAFVADVASAAATYVAHAGQTWAAITADCKWLDTHGNSRSATRVMSRRSLWFGKAPTKWKSIWQKAAERLVAVDPSYIVWVEWYERRVRGERASFDIPGDKGRYEDKQVLERIASAKEKDLWSRPVHDVNCTLQRWIEEARARVATNIEPPKQEPGAIAYGPNVDGKIDRLPPAQQDQLRDLPDQRQIYADMRREALELAREGQRLGQRLDKSVQRLLVSAPERFEDALAYPLWRDGNALRRIYRAHLAAAQIAEPDPARLDPVVAESLNGVVDLYNLLSFGDDGLRAKDEAVIPPQERTRAQAEAAVGEPIVAAIFQTPEIATKVALDDLSAGLEDQGLPDDDPYRDHVIDQLNRTRRNWIAALITGARKGVAEAKKTGKSVREGAERAAGAAIVSDAAGLTNVYRPLIRFVATYAKQLKDFVANAYPRNSIGDLIDAIKNFFTAGG